MTLRRAGGVLLILIGVALLAGPVQALFGGVQAHNADERHAILDAMIYQLTLGGVLALFGAFFLSTKPRKAETTDAAD
jgi:drug/metabolite transporter (DMT)-like permease